MPVRGDVFGRTDVDVETTVDAFRASVPLLEGDPDLLLPVRSRMTTVEPQFFD